MPSASEPRMSATRTSAARETTGRATVGVVGSSVVSAFARFKGLGCVSGSVEGRARAGPLPFPGVRPEEPGGSAATWSSVRWAMIPSILRRDVAASG